MSKRNYVILTAMLLGALIHLFSSFQMSESSLKECLNITFILVVFFFCINCKISSEDCSLTNIRKAFTYFISTAIIAVPLLLITFSVPIIEGLIFSAVLCGMMIYGKNFESFSLASTPLMLFVTFVLLALRDSYISIGWSWEICLLIFKNFFVGVLVGLLFGLMVYYLTRKEYSRSKILVVFAASFVSYLVANSLESNGYVSVMIVALSFGFNYEHYEPIVGELFKMVLVFVEAVAFFILGFMMNLPWNWNFSLYSILVFVGVFFSRFGGGAFFLNYQPKTALDVALRGGVSSALAPLAISFLVGDLLTIGFLLSAVAVLALLVAIITEIIKIVNRPI